jgi:hypothetical protein
MAGTRKVAAYRRLATTDPGPAGLDLFAQVLPVLGAKYPRLEIDRWYPVRRLHQNGDAWLPWGMGKSRSTDGTSLPDRGAACPILPSSP